MTVDLQFCELKQEIDPYRWLVQNRTLPADWTNPSICLWRMLEHAYVLKMTEFLFASYKNLCSRTSLLQPSTKQISAYHKFQARLGCNISICKSSFSEVLKFTFLSKKEKNPHLNVRYFECCANRFLGLREKKNNKTTDFIYTCITSV